MLDALLKLKKELEIELEKVKSKIEGERLKIVENKYGVKVGSIVKNSKGKLFRVVDVDVRFGVDDKPWLQGNPQKKNGEFGVAVQHVYRHWTLVKS